MALHCRAITILYSFSLRYPTLRRRPDSRSTGSAPGAISPIWDMEFYHTYRWTMPGHLLIRQRSIPQTHKFNYVRSAQIDGRRVAALRKGLIYRAYQTLEFSGQYESARQTGLHTLSRGLLLDILHSKR